MRPTMPLLVLVIRGTGLRTTLTARLSMAGADLVTTDNLDDPRIARWLRDSPVLIIEDVALASYEGGEATLRGDPRWRAVAVIGDGGAGEEDSPRIARADAAAAIEAMLPGWGYPER